MIQELEKLNIKYDRVYHNEIKSIEEANQLNIKITGIGTKSLFLTNKKNKYYIYVLKDNKRADLNKLSIILNEKKLTFSNNLEIINSDSGSITPLSIINDKEILVKVLIDKSLLNETILIHPENNKSTINIRTIDLIRYIIDTNHDYKIIGE